MHDGWLCRLVAERHVEGVSRPEAETRFAIGLLQTKDTGRPTVHLDGAADNAENAGLRARESRQGQRRGEGERGSAGGRALQKCAAIHIRLLSIEFGSGIAADEFARQLSLIFFKGLQLAADGGIAG